MAAKVEAEKYDKIYFTRTKLTKRNPVWGEKEIEKLFAKNGFKVFSPEQLSLRKQIALMKGCKELATVASTTYHNLVFAKNNTRLIALNRSFQANQTQFIVDQAKKLDATYIDVSLAPLPITHVYGPWIVGQTEELQNFLKDNNLEFNDSVNCVTDDDLFLFLKSWSHHVNKNVTPVTKDEIVYMQEKINFIRKRFFGKVKHPNSKRRDFYFCGVKIFSYNSKYKNNNK